MKLEAILLALGALPITQPTTAEVARTTSAAAHPDSQVGGGNSLVERSNYWVERSSADALRFESFDHLAYLEFPALTASPSQPLELRVWIHTLLADGRWVEREAGRRSFQGEQQPWIEVVRGDLAPNSYAAVTLTSGALPPRELATVAIEGSLFALGAKAEGEGEAVVRIRCVDGNTAKEGDQDCKLKKNCFGSTRDIELDSGATEVFGVASPCSFTVPAGCSVVYE